MERDTRETRRRSGGGESDRGKGGGGGGSVRLVNREKAMSKTLNQSSPKDRGSHGSRHDQKDSRSQSGGSNSQSPSGSSSSSGSHSRSRSEEPPARRSRNWASTDHAAHGSNRRRSPGGNTNASMRPGSIERRPPRGNGGSTSRYQDDGPPPPGYHRDDAGSFRGRGRSSNFRGGAGSFNGQRFPFFLEHLPPEENPSATRTLFVGNIDPELTSETIRRIFEQFGVVEEVRLKHNAQSQGNPFAFVRYFNLNQAHVAKTEMSGKFLGRFHCKIGYGRPTPTNCVWVGGLGPWLAKKDLEKEFSRFGQPTRVSWPSNADYAYLVYDDIETARETVEQMRGYVFRGTDVRLRTDFADAGQIDIAVACLASRRIPFHLPGIRSPPGGARSGHGGKDSSRRHRRDGSSGSSSSSGGSGSRDGKKRRMGGRKKRHASSASSSSGSNSGSGRSDGSGRRPARKRRSGRTVCRISNIEEVVEVADLARCLPVVWTGRIMLKKRSFAVRMLLVSGRANLIDELLLLDDQAALGGESEQSLKITQRLRMDEPKLEEVRRRITMSGPDGWSILLAMPTPGGGEGDEGGASSLSELVAYLKEKKAAGVLALPPDCQEGEEGGILHIFPPCRFAHQYLLGHAPKLKMDYTTADYILLFLVRVKT